MKTAPEALKILWTRKFFEEKRSLPEIREALSKELKCNPTNQNLAMALKGAKFLSRSGNKGHYTYKQKGPSKEVELNEDVLPGKLVISLGKDFETEIKDLQLNFGRSGNCTAFLLRKILEKLIFLAFARNGLTDKLKDSNGDFLGLKAMLNMAISHKIHGKPFLMPKTSKEIGGIKFLGDTSAHNPMTDVEMKTIIPQMPFIITAYQELSQKL